MPWQAAASGSVRHVPWSKMPFPVFAQITLSVTRSARETAMETAANIFVLPFRVLNARKNAKAALTTTSRYSRRNGLLMRKGRNAVK